MQKATLGERIRHARKELGMTQEDLAGKDFTKGFISLVELDKAKPSLQSLTVLAARLNKPLSYFLEDRLESKRDIDLLCNLGEGHLKQGEVDEALAKFQEALGLSSEMDDASREALCYRNIGLAHFQRREYPKAIQYLQQALSRYQEAEMGEELARTYFQLASVYHHHRKLTQAIEAYRHSLELLEAISVTDESFRLKVLANLASAYWKVGELNEAQTYYQKALDAARNATDFYLIGSTYMGLGLLYRERGELNKAFAYSTKALELFEIHENVQLMADLHNNIGILYADQQDWEQALAHYEESLRLRRSINDIPRQAYTFTELARYHCLQGQLDEASAFCDRALAHLGDLDDPVERGRIALLQGIIARRRQDWSEAMSRLEYSARLFADNNVKTELAEAYSELGLLYGEQGDTRKSNEYLARSISLFKEAGTNRTGYRYGTAGQQ